MKIHSALCLTDEPDNWNSEQCVIMGYTEKVHDVTCYAKATFVCEKRGMFLIHLKIYCCYKLPLSVYLLTWINSESTLIIDNST